VAYGYRRPHPQNWPAQLSALVASCLAHTPADRPTAAQVCAPERLTMIQAKCKRATKSAQVLAC